MSTATEQTTTTETVTDTSKPDRYNVVLHNDDFTPVDFVLEVLITLYQMSEDQAHNLTMYIHNNGYGIAGTYTLEVAETLQTFTLQMAQQERHPLEVTVELAQD